MYNDEKLLKYQLQNKKKVNMKWAIFVNNMKWVIDDNVKR